jgi:hypothetical protein
MRAYPNPIDATLNVYAQSTIMVPHSRRPKIPDLLEAE